MTGQTWAGVISQTENRRQQRQERRSADSELRQTLR